MGSNIKKLLPVIILTIFLAILFIPSQSSAKTSDGSSKIKVHTGDVTAVTENAFFLQTEDVKDSRYSEVYFDIPLNLKPPYFISFKVDYATSNKDETVELVFPEFTYGFVPSAHEYWSTYADKLTKSKYAQFEYKDPTAKLKQNNLVYLYLTDEKFPKLVIHINYIPEMNYAIDIKKTKSLGIKIHAKKGERKTASITNLVMAEGPLAVEAYAFLEEEGKNVEGAYAQWKRELEESTERARKENANKPKKVDPIEEALARREVRRKERRAEEERLARESIAALLASIFSSSSSTSGSSSVAGQRAVVMCTGSDGYDYETGFYEPCTSSDTYTSCIHRLEDRLRAQGYHYTVSYCTTSRPGGNVDYHGGSIDIRY